MELYHVIHQVTETFVYLFSTYEPTAVLQSITLNIHRVAPVQTSIIDEDYNPSWTTLFAQKGDIVPTNPGVIFVSL